MWCHGNFGWGGWIVMMGSMAAFWGLVVWAVLAFVRGAGGRPRSPEDPERILAARFAAGEIDEDEYHRRLDALRTGPPPIPR